MKAVRPVIAIAGVFAAIGLEPETRGNYSPSVHNRHVVPLKAASIPVVVAICASSAAASKLGGRECQVSECREANFLQYTRDVFW